MKRNMLCLAALAALAFAGCRKIEMDGEKEVIVINGGGTGTSTGKRVELSGTISKDTILRKGDDNLLKGIVYITNGATLDC
jgi:outer membrane lipoprotein SlyB